MNPIQEIHENENMDTLKHLVFNCIHHCAQICGVDTPTAMRVAHAKYSLRARPGNPKDDEAEREACERAVSSTEAVLTMQQIVELAAMLPSGLQDAKAVQKLEREYQELVDAIEVEDRIGALTELADVVYYGAKVLEYNGVVFLRRKRVRRERSGEDSGVPRHWSSSGVE